MFLIRGDRLKSHEKIDNLSFCSKALLAKSFFELEIVVRLKTSSLDAST